MADAVKRKEPESDRNSASETKGDKQPAPAAEPTTEKPATSSEPASKRLKPTAPDTAAVKKQIEYYLSDENLKYDKFFHDKISEDENGWLQMSLVLSCNKMQAMRATKEDVMNALKDSKIEVREDGAAIRRPSKAPLPTLEAKPAHQKKSTIHAHDGGVLAVFKNIPEEQSWVQVKEKLKEKLPPKAQLWYVSQVSEKNQCIVSASPFDGDVQFFDELIIDVGGAKVKSEVCYAELLQQALKALPKHIRDKRERESRRLQKERNRPIAVGTQRFNNVAVLRGRVKEILSARSDGEHLKPEGTDFNLIKALLEYHPKGPEKSEGMIGIKVAKSPQADNRCFWMIKEGGVEEDFSAKKCLDAVELDPPYVKIETKDKKPAGGPSAPTASTGAPATAPAATPTETPAEGTPTTAAPATSEATTEAAPKADAPTAEEPCKE